MKPSSSFADSYQAAGGIWIEPSPKRIRARVSGHTAFDTRAALMVWEHPYYPQYYVPVGDVDEALIAPSVDVTPAAASANPSLGPAVGFDLVDDARVIAHHGVWRHTDAVDSRVANSYRFAWPAMDAWFEEDTEVYIHPRSPYVRVDALASSRHVRVEIDGVTVAESNRPTLLFETGLPTRYYLPQTDVDAAYLSSSDSSTGCPYKGTARYWNVTVDGTEHTDLVWGYDAPLAESAPVAGLMCFYNEKVDLFVDGQPG